MLISAIVKFHEILHRRFGVGEHNDLSSLTSIYSIGYLDLVALDKG